MSDTVKAPKFRRGVLRDSVNYLADRPNKVITAEEIAKATNWQREKIMHALASSSFKGDTTDPRVKNIEKLSTGMWRYVVAKVEEVQETTQQPAQQPAQLSGETFTVTIIKETEEAYIVVDNDANVYKMILVA